MEKTYTQPVACEIAIKGPIADGHADAFAYDPSSQNMRALGHLFVVGNVSRESEDMAYAINLVSALAKREYYARQDLSPREAFTATLRKINEVVEEFFKNKDFSLNIGIFAITGGQMLISKLGKFKVILARDKRNIDVLNNVDLFNKELTKEKQFSNIISGKITDSDRILAFYPSRTIIAREKSLKEHFLKLPQDAFIEKLHAIKKEKDSFGCAALYISFQKVTEQAEDLRPTPREMAQAAILAGHNTRKSKQAEASSAHQATQEKTNMAASKKDTHITATEMPRIIPSEFSLGKKAGPIALFIRRMRLPHFSRRGKLALYGVGAIVLIAILIGAKTAFIPSKTEKEARIKVGEAKTALQTAQTKISENDQAGAREILTNSLAAISVLGDTQQTAQVKSELASALDTLDNAEDIVSHVVIQFPEETGQVTLVALSSATPAVLATGKDNTMNVLLVENGSVAQTVPISGISSGKLLSGKDSISLLDTDAKTLATVSGGKAVTAKLGITEAIAVGALYENNLYAVAGQTIKKVSDAAKGETKASDWLTSGTIEGQVAGIAVDGNLYILFADGKLVTYFRGKQKGVFQLPLTPASNMKLVVAGDNPNLYLINRAAGRVYLIDKNLGSIVRTLKLGSAEIVDATVDEAGTVYYLTKDSKLWKTE